MPSLNPIGVGSRAAWLANEEGSGRCTGCTPTSWPAIASWQPAA